MNHHQVGLASKGHGVVPQDTDFEKHAGWGDWMRSGKFAWMRFETHFCRLIECLLLFYFNPLVISEIDLNLLNLAENEGEKSNPPFDKLVDFLKINPLRTGPSRSLRRMTGAWLPLALRPRKLSREGCYKLYIWISHDMYESCVINVKWNVNI